MFQLQWPGKLWCDSTRCHSRGTSGVRLGWTEQRELTSGLGWTKVTFHQLANYKDCTSYLSSFVPIWSTELDSLLDLTHNESLPRSAARIFGLAHFQGICPYIRIGRCSAAVRIFYELFGKQIVGPIHDLHAVATKSLEALRFRCGSLTLPQPRTKLFALVRVKTEEKVSSFLDTLQNCIELEN